MKKKIMLWSSGGLLVMLLATVVWVGLKLKPLVVSQAKTVDANLQIFISGGGNSIILISEDKQQALIVDTKMGPGSKQLKNYITNQAPQAQVTVVNTHFHSDHTQGNKLFPHATLIAGHYQDDFWKTQAGVRLPNEWIDPEEEKIIEIDDERIHVRNMGQAHTQNDTVVYLEQRKLLVTGDIVFNGWHPALFKEAGTHVGKWISVLDDLIERYDIEILVPGHGPVTDQKGLYKKREYFLSIKAAKDNPEKLAQLRERYKGFFALPGIASFEKTLTYIREESQSQ